MADIGPPDTVSAGLRDNIDDVAVLIMAILGRLKCLALLELRHYHPSQCNSAMLHQTPHHSQGFLVAAFDYT